MQQISFCRWKHSCKPLFKLFLPNTDEIKHYRINFRCYCNNPRYPLERVHTFKYSLVRNTKPPGAMNCAKDFIWSITQGIMHEVRHILEIARGESIFETGDERISFHMEVLRRKPFSQACVSITT